MNTGFDNFIKGPLTSILGLLIMSYAAYGRFWVADKFTDWQALGIGLVGFVLLFMRDTLIKILADYIGKFFTMLLEKFFGKKPD